MRADDIALGQLIATAFAGGAGLLLSWAVYKLSGRQRDDSWQIHFASIHDSFWNDDDYKEVRSWLSCDQAYPAVSGVLAKCLDKAEDPSITPKEYENLDKLDKFLNLMTRVIALDTGSKTNRRLLETLFFRYWLKRATKKTDDENLDKNDLYKYVERYYPAITAYVNRI